MNEAQETPFDAILLVSFGGPEGPDDVMPFLENVLRGRDVPRERMLEVAEHYKGFGGVSPINQQCRELLEAMKAALRDAGIDLPLYWGNRNWHPMLADTVEQMRADGIRHALAFVTSSVSSYSSCRQYREDIEKARAVVGPDAPVIEKIRPFFNHPDFVAATSACLQDALDRVPADRRSETRVAYTAHSIPLSMGRACDYQEQLTELGRLCAEAAGLAEDRWELVFQSRSGPPQVPWLEPDILDHVRAEHERGTRDLVVLPIGFLSDHMEVKYDLDTEAVQLAEELGMNLVRGATVGTSSRFLAAIVSLVRERIEGVPAAAAGRLPARPHACAANCCPAPQRPGRPGRPPEGARA